MFLTAPKIQNNNLGCFFSLCWIFDCIYRYWFSVSPRSQITWIQICIFQFNFHLNIKRKLHYYFVNTSIHSSHQCSDLLVIIINLVSLMKMIELILLRQLVFSVNDCSLWSEHSLSTLRCQFSFVCSFIIRTVSVPVPVSVCVDGQQFSYSLLIRINFWSSYKHTPSFIIIEEKRKPQLNVNSQTSTGYLIIQLKLCCRCCYCCYIHHLTFNWMMIIIVLSMCVC